MLVLAALLSFSRVYVGTHYPGDVVAGALIGAAAAALLYLVRPLRRSLEALSRRCGVIWDVVLRRVTLARAAG
jgi:membrane-associated phospholipid phosphatase